MTVRRPAGGPRFLKSARDGLMFFSRRGTLEPGRTADVAQLVERNLAKVEVASSSLVVRSERVVGLPIPVEWPRGEATACKAVYTGSNPVSTSRTSSGSRWTIGAAVARFPDTEEVTGSIPVSPTTDTKMGPDSGPFSVGRGHGFPLINSLLRGMTTRGGLEWLFDRALMAHGKNAARDRWRAGGSRFAGPWR